jgi:hypothetical protein
MVRNHVLRVRVSEGELQRLHDRCRRFDLSVPDFIRAAMASYDPKITQALLDKLVVFLAQSNPVQMTRPIKKPIIPEGEVSLSLSASPPDQIRRKKPRRSPVAKLNQDQDLIHEIAEEIIEVIPSTHQGKIQKIAQFLLALLRTDPSEAKLYETFINKLFEDVQMVPSEMIPLIHDALTQCRDIVKTM